VPRSGRCRRAQQAGNHANLLGEKKQVSELATLRATPQLTQCRPRGGSGKPQPCGVFGWHRGVGGTPGRGGARSFVLLPQAGKHGGPGALPPVGIPCAQSLVACAPSVWGCCGLDRVGAFKWQASRIRFQPGHRSHNAFFCQQDKKRPQHAPKSPTPWPRPAQAKVCDRPRPAGAPGELPAPSCRRHRHPQEGPQHPFVTKLTCEGHAPKFT
jgi:hypothetical protein